MAIPSAGATSPKGGGSASPSAKRQKQDQLTALKSMTSVVMAGDQRWWGRVNRFGSRSTYRSTHLSHRWSPSILFADTGDIGKIKQYKPEDATTNPTLLLQACQMPEYKNIVDAAVAKAKAEMQTSHSQPRCPRWPCTPCLHPSLRLPHRGVHDYKSIVDAALGKAKAELSEGNADEEALLEEICDQLAVAFGIEILKLVPGYVSTEVNAELSFDTEKSVAKARKIIHMYEKAGYPKSRILIKLGSTWECIRACEILEKEEIRCNMTLLFSFCQAVACAEAGATLISPFVGRILDWYKKANPSENYAGEKDPGVVSVRKIYEYYRFHSYKTIVMAASFRTKDEISCLAGCDKLTIGPKFLQELEDSAEPLPRKLDPGAVKKMGEKKPHKLDEKKFRFDLNEDQMATEKLSEGIRNFHKDFLKLKALVKEKFL